MLPRLWDQKNLPWPVKSIYTCWLEQFSWPLVHGEKGLVKLLWSQNRGFKVFDGYFQMIFIQNSFSVPIYHLTYIPSQWNVALNMHNNFYPLPHTFHTNHYPNLPSNIHKINRHPIKTLTYLLSQNIITEYHFQGSILQRLQN